MTIGLYAGNNKRILSNDLSIECITKLNIVYVHVGMCFEKLPTDCDVNYDGRTWWLLRLVFRSVIGIP